MNPKLRSLLLLFAVPTAFAARPNIVMILADDMGYSDLGCYGGEIATPNLDRLAQGGLRFTQAYNTGRCWPSRAALLTGYYAQQVRRDVVPGIASGGRGIRPAWAPLVTEFVRPAGYRTYHVGKWHLDGKPLQNGFDHSFEVTASNYFNAATCTDDGRPMPQTPDFYATTVMADHAVGYLREHTEKFPDRPFFLYLAFTAPHFPLQAPPDDIARYRDTYRSGWNAMAAARHARLVELGLPSNPPPAMEREIGPPYDFPRDLAKLGPNEVNRPLPWNQLSEAQREFQAAKMAIHAAMVGRMDREIGRVIAQLEAMGAIENTLILFASDNGASAEMMVRGEGHDPSAPMGSRKTFLSLGPGWASASNTPFRRHKTWTFEGGISTPLIAYWPAGIEARGKLRHTPVHFIDIAPTVLELAGVTKPAMIKDQPVPAAPGLSLVPLFARDVPFTHADLWWEHEGNRALRIGDWKIVAAAKHGWELYDLATDRGESHDLADQFPERVRTMAAQWEREYAAICHDAFTDPPPTGAKDKAPSGEP